MSKTLILMRHAKSSWDSPALADHDRPLNGRGRKSARAMGDWLRVQGWVADEVLSSSSARTRETYERLRLGCPAGFTGALYHAGPEAMMQALQTATGDTVLMLGHNPGIAEFAHDIVASEPDHPRFLDYPTCAILVARFAISDWSDVSWRSGEVLDFAIPREVIAANEKAGHPARPFRE